MSKVFTVMLGEDGNNTGWIQRLAAGAPCRN